jgi:hypothetical protein
MRAMESETRCAMKQLVVVVVQIKAKGEGMSLFRRRNSPNE